MSKQMRLKGVGGWGGRRRGAGRPRRSREVSHRRRERVLARTPLHLTWRIRENGVNLRCREVLTCFQTAALGAQAFGLRVIEFSLQHNHLHMIVEVRDNSSLALGMRSFGCRLGKALRKIMGGVGSVFEGRYHLHVLRTPTQMRNALAYVLQNYSRHARLLRHVDEFSSGPYFAAWRKLFGRELGPLLSRRRRRGRPEFLGDARSWLAREGWMRGISPPIST